MDLHKIANSGSYGSGQKARDIAHELAERRALIPEPSLMATLLTRTSMYGVPVAAFGVCPDTDEDWVFEHESELGLVDGVQDSASTNAKVIAAVWNAFRDGDLVWASDRSAPTPQDGEGE